MKRRSKRRFLGRSKRKSFRKGGKNKQYVKRIKNYTVSRGGIRM